MFYNYLIIGNDPVDQLAQIHWLKSTKNPVIGLRGVEESLFADYCDYWINPENSIRNPLTYKPGDIRCAFPAFKSTIVAIDVGLDVLATMALLEINISELGRQVVPQEMQDRINQLADYQKIITDKEWKHQDWPTVDNLWPNVGEWKMGLSLTALSCLVKGMISQDKPLHEIIGKVIQYIETGKINSDYCEQAIASRNQVVAAIPSIAIVRSDECISALCTNRLALPKLLSELGNCISRVVIACAYLNKWSVPDENGNRPENLVDRHYEISAHQPAYLDTAGLAEELYRIEPIWDFDEFQVFPDKLKSSNITIENMISIVEKYYRGPVAIAPK